MWCLNACLDVPWAAFVDSYNVIEGVGTQANARTSGNDNPVWPICAVMEYYME